MCDYSRSHVLFLYCGIALSPSVRQHGINCDYIVGRRKMERGLNMAEEIMNQGMEDTEGAAASTAEEMEGTQGEEHGENSVPERKYTDEDVDKIIARKIAAERSRLQKLFNEEQQESELDIRERKILERELKADAKDALVEQGVPSSLANLIDYSSKESMEKSMAEVVDIFRKSVTAGIKDALRGHTPRTGEPAYKDSYLRDAFAPNKHLVR